MATTFNVIFLGVSAIDIDPIEGNTISEDVGLLVGTTFGASDDPLFDNVQTLSPVGNPGTAYDSNNNPDQFSVDGTTYRFDGGGGYNVTITYADGTTATAIAKIAQTTTGELYLFPDLPGQEANQALFEAKPIQSITLDSVGPQGTGMATERLDGNFIEPVYGTDGNDNMIVGYTDANGNMVTDGADLIIAGDGDDNINAGDGNDTIYAGAGNDVIDDWNGDDLVYAGDGNDTANVSVGNDTYYMEGGDDLVNVWDNAGHNTFYGGDGFDTLDFQNWQSTSGASVTFTDDGAGTFSHFNGATTGTFEEFEFVSGTAYSDTLDASMTTSGIMLDGAGGNDIIIGGSGDDLLLGGAGDDVIFGGDGDDFIGGESGDDTIYGGAGSDSLYGDDGNDVLYGNGIEATFDPAAHAPTHTGAATTFTLENNSTETLHLYWINYDGELVLYETLAPGDSAVQPTFEGHNWVLYDAASGQPLQYLGNPADGATITYVPDNNLLDGGAGNDTLFGGAGNDVLIGGAGNDLITTGAGADTVSLQDGGGTDTITDFDMTLVGGKTTDQLDVSNLTNASGGPVTWLDVVVTDTNGDGTGDAILTFPGSESVILLGVSPDQVDEKQELFQLGIPCFAAGSPILTPSGPRAVETLARGDLVQTQDGPAPLIWAGSRSLGPADLASDPGQRPIHFAAGAIGNNLPLRLSPQHAVQIVGSDGSPVLVRAKHLAEAGVRGVRIARCVQSVSYHHLLLERHSTLSAAGAIVESMYPGRMALASFPITARLAIAAAIIGGQSADDTSVIDLEDLSQIYGPRCFPLLGRDEALRACRTGGTFQSFARKPRLPRLFGPSQDRPAPEKQMQTGRGFCRSGRQFRVSAT